MAKFHSPNIYETDVAASEARAAHLARLPPLKRPDVAPSGPNRPFPGSRLAAAVDSGKTVHFGDVISHPHNRRFVWTPARGEWLFHATRASCRRDINARGLVPRALSDFGPGGPPHSRLAPAVWVSEKVTETLAHIKSPHTIHRHVENKLCTWATWHKVIFYAFRKTKYGFTRRPMPPTYLNSGPIFETVQPDYQLSVDLSESGDTISKNFADWVSSFEAQSESDSSDSSDDEQSEPEDSGCIIA